MSGFMFAGKRKNRFCGMLSKKIANGLYKVLYKTFNANRKR